MTNRITTVNQSRSNYLALICTHQDPFPAFLNVTSVNPTSNAYKLLRAEDVEYDRLPPKGAHICTHTHYMFLFHWTLPPQIPSHSSPPPTLIHTLPLSRATWKLTPWIVQFTVLINIWQHFPTPMSRKLSFNTCVCHWTFPLPTTLIAELFPTCAVHPRLTNISVASIWKC